MSLRHSTPRNGLPRQVARFPIHAERTDAAIDWNYPASEL